MALLKMIVFLLIISAMLVDGRALRKRRQIYGMNPDTPTSGTYPSGSFYASLGTYGDPNTGYNSAYDSAYDSAYNPGNYLGTNSFYNPSSDYSGIGGYNSYGLSGQYNQLGQYGGQYGQFNQYPYNSMYGNNMQYPYGSNYNSGYPNQGNIYGSGQIGQNMYGYGSMGYFPGGSGAGLSNAGLWYRTGRNSGVQPRSGGQNSNGG